MSKNRIIPQMFDVKPVDETGDLDWQKIQSIGGLTECVGDEPSSIERGFQMEEIEFVGEQSSQIGALKANAYVLGVPVEHDFEQPQLQDEFDFSEFDFCVGDESRDISFGNAKVSESVRIQEEKMKAQRAEEARRMLRIAEQKLFFQQQENMRKEKEAHILIERQKQELAIKFQREEKEHQRMMLLDQEKKRAEEKRTIELERIKNLQKEKEAALMAERQERDRQYAEWLEKEMQAEEKAKLWRESIAEKSRSALQEKESQKIAQQNEREEFMRAEALAKQDELRKIAEQNRQKQEVYEAAVLAEREDRERQHAEWLAKEMQAEAKALELEQAIAKKIANTKKKDPAKKNWLGDENSVGDFSWRELLFPKSLAFQFDVAKSLRAFVVVALLISFSVGSVTYASKGLGLKGKIMGASTDGLANLNLAVDDISKQNFEGGAQKLDQAFANFSDGSTQLESMGGILLDATRYVPFASKLSSGKNAIEAGKHFSAAGKSLNEVARMASKLKNPIDLAQKQEVSLLDVFKVAQTNITDAKKELDEAQKNLDKISIDDLPEANRDKFLLVKQKLPDLLSAMDFFLNNSHILADLLGGNGPRKYLFLFQNNSEMRATGGFIGSYGLLDISNGHVKKFFIDGIFNPDGQLKDRIVPPMPIQKISANWSMHDSNWFADFPMSAKKAIQFYEKTGGPTADGVITLTPTVMQKLLEITGPIEMPEYDVTLDKNNFIELTQYKVEVDYDKQENKPKKILSDLAPMVLEKLLSSKDMEVVSRTAEAFLSGLNEKHILFYSENAELQKIISKQGWSGEILQSPKDYLSVVNTNVNGFKTDAVIDESINHAAEIQDDGNIVDTVTITRKHKGGNSEYEWLNKVNADYMRVYVPEGSRLLEVSGQTREASESPVDYDALGFKRDEDVQKEEGSIEIDPVSGTRIYKEAGKTVFANWTYVSPGETMTITYKYLLPFSLFKVSVGKESQVDSYALTLQKQSGSLGSSFASQISFPSTYDVKWNFPAESQKINGGFKNSGILKTDKFEGIVFEKK